MGEGLKEEIKQVHKEINYLKNEIRAETETLSQYHKKLALAKQNNRLLKAEVK